MGTGPSKADDAGDDMNDFEKNLDGGRVVNRLDKELLGKLSFDFLVQRIFSLLTFNVVEYIKRSGGKKMKKYQNFLDGKKSIEVTEFYGYFKSDPKRKIYIIFSNFILGAPADDPLGDWRTHYLNMYERFLPTRRTNGITTLGIFKFYTITWNTGPEDYDIVTSKNLSSFTSLRVFESTNTMSTRLLRQLPYNTLESLSIRFNVCHDLPDRGSSSSEQDHDQPLTIHRDGINMINNFENLRILRLYFSPKFDKTQSNLTVTDFKLPKLEKLSIDFGGFSFTKLSNEQQEKFVHPLFSKSTYHSLKELSFQGGRIVSKIERKNNEPVYIPHQVKRLSIRCPNLRKLYLEKMSFSGYKFLSKCKNLKVISLISCKKEKNDDDDDDDDGYHHIFNSIPNIERIVFQDVEDMDLKEEKMIDFSPTSRENSSLKYVNLMFLNHSGLEHLFEKLVNVEGLELHIFGCYSIWKCFYDVLKRNENNKTKGLVDNNNKDSIFLGKLELLVLRGPSTNFIRNVEDEKVVWEWIEKFENIDIKKVKL